MTDLNKAMDAIAKLEDKHKVSVKGGKFYTQVVTRVEMFRREFGLEYSIITNIEEFGGGIMSKAAITSPEGKIVGTGHAWAAMINKEKCIEKLETTAVGRALASIGLSGGEYCSQNELDTYEERYEKPTQEERESQLEAIDGLYGWDNLADFDDYTAGMNPATVDLPDVLRETYENQRDICREQLAAGVIPERPGFRFIGVEHAIRWATSVPGTMQEMNAQFEIDKWIEINQRRIDALDTMLKADKYIKNGQTPGERVQGKIDERKQKIGEGIAA